MAKPPPPPPPSAAEVSINQIALRNASFQDAARSWLDSAYGEVDKPSPNEKPEPELKLELQPDSHGVGYVAPAGERGATSTVAATEKLRRQMLGKRARGPDSYGGLMASKPRPKKAVRRDESEDEEEGRSGVGRRGKKDTAKTDGQRMDAEQRQQAPATQAASAESPAPQPPKRGMTYLDQVLAERAAKKKKKKKGKG